MKNKNKKPHYQFRRIVVLSVFALAIVGLFLRALDMQVINQAFFQQQGDARHLRVVPISAHRGDIYDRNGEPLAISTPVDSVWVNPKEIKNDLHRVTEIAKTLKINAQHLRNKLVKNSNREFVYILRQVSPDTGEKIKALGIPGVYLQREYKRYYPAGEVTSHVIGFSDVDDIGQEGLELAYDEWLSGEPGSKRVIRDRLGQVIDDVERIKTAEPGKSVRLSIDRRIQYLAYQSLKSAVKEHKAIAGSAVVLDVHTGEVLAMVNQPSFNANDRSQLKPGVYRNRSVTDVFEPGSTMKPFTIAAALETGRWHPKDNVKTSPGYYKVQGSTIKDMRNYGKINLEEIILKSSNVGVSKVALSLDQEQQLGMYMKLGFGINSGSGFPGERNGNLRTGHLSEFERATMSFGYSLSVTPLQLARAYSSIAADGVIYPVSFLRRDKEVEGEQVMSLATAKKVRHMMERVVSPEGTANKASIANYRVAGKTGTVHKFISGGYAKDRYLSVFAGMAPASDPRLVMVVMLNEPRNGKYFGGQVAAPVFSRVISGALRLLDVPPDDLKYAQKESLEKKGKSA
ncbi:MAG: cell division protein [endosymbiont of Galathealinum brachiosum]|uniref:Peptidoglycan D,D-transpeptidase FtsI n=1 Tax=endosymbiont of Galathealinum brachiosum TaxID=2200906 RepID=A0A370DAD9_9GAMM|nr:MAG: cell division protein [endosymbiont of Galathealinum brachiosum]